MTDTHTGFITTGPFQGHHRFQIKTLLVLFGSASKALLVRP